VEELTMGGRLEEEKAPLPKEGGGTYDKKRQAQRNMEKRGSNGVDQSCFKPNEKQAHG